MYFDQEDVQTHYRTDEFVFGEQILACPVLEPNAKGRRMYVPKGNWYNFWTDEVIKGGKEMWVDADIDSMPIFVKEGAIIPKYPIQQYVGEKEITELTLDVYYKEGKDKSELFSDANDGYDYTKGRYSLRNFTLRGKANELIINQFKEGKFMTTYETFNIQFHGLPFDMVEVQLDNEKIVHKSLKLNGITSIVVDKNFSELHILGIKSNE